MLDFDWLISPVDEELSAAATAATTSTASSSTALVPAATTTAREEPGFWSQVGSGFQDLFSGVGAWFRDPAQVSPASRLADGLGSGVAGLGSGVGAGVAGVGSGVGSGAAAAGSGVGRGMTWGLPIALGLGAVVLGAVLLVKLPGGGR